MPAISVVMPVYNAAPFLREAIDSILTQSFSDFELLILNDGSTDASKEIISSYADARIRLIDHNVNRGYVKLLNEGIGIASGKYLARMDADDVSESSRFAIQYEFMESNPGYVVYGSSYKLIGSGKVNKMPLTDEEIKLKMLYLTPFCHPSVIIRTQILKQHKLFYDESHMPAEDHMMWVNLSKYGRFGNSEQPLLNYRIHNNNISTKKRTETQVQKLRDAQLIYLKSFFPFLHEKQIHSLHHLFFSDEFTLSSEDLNSIIEVVNTILNSDEIFPVDRVDVRAILKQWLLYRLNTSTHLGMGAWNAAKYITTFKMSRIYQMRLLLKSLIRFTKR